MGSGYFMCLGRRKILFFGGCLFGFGFLDLVLFMVVFILVKLKVESFIGEKKSLGFGRENV